MPKKKNFLENSQFGSLPPRVIIIFSMISLLFIVGSAIMYMLIEQWSFTNSIYFAVITMSTVGYGDIVPETPVGKFVNIAFILVSFCAVFLFFRVVVGYVVDQQINLVIQKVMDKRKDRQKTNRGFFSFRQKSDDHNELANDANDAIHEIKVEETSDIHTGKNLRWIVHVCAYVLWLVVWVIFYSFHKEEDFSILDALYFGVVTSSTLGYGKFVPHSSGGKLFCVFFALFGVLSLGILAGSVSTGLMALIRGIFVRKKKNAEIAYNERLETLLEAPKSGQGNITKFDFVYQMLIGEGKLNKSDVDKLLAEFQRLDTDGNGVLDVHDFNPETQHQLEKAETIQLTENVRRESNIIAMDL